MVHSGLRPWRLAVRLLIATIAIAGIAGAASMGAVPALAQQANQPPVAADDSGSTTVDQPVTIAVLDNDSDPDGDALTVTAVTNPPNGSAAINADNTVTYTPDSGFTGTDSFFYIVTDGQGGADSAEVTIDVAAGNAAPVATDDTATTDEDTAVAVAVLANDTDADGDTLSVASTSGATNGTAAINADDTVTFTPDADFNGDGSFMYTVDDGNGGSDTATVTVTVAAVNDAPTATDDTAATPHDTAVTINVLANDSDPDGDTLSVTSAGPAANGAVVINADNTITFTPTAGFEGDATFPYTVSDGAGGSDTGTGTVTVGENQAPTATNDSASTEMDQAVTIDVLANDSDPEGDTLMVTDVSDPANGSSAINADETVTYTPDAGFTGTDTFTYTVSDGAGNTDTATVAVEVGEPAPEPGDFVIFRITLSDGTVIEFEGPAVLEPLLIQVFGADNVEVLPIPEEPPEEREQVTICHIPPGNPDAARTITVGEPAVDAHMGHGDTMGECTEEQLSADDEDDDRGERRGRGPNRGDDSEEDDED